VAESWRVLHALMDLCWPMVAQQRMKRQANLGWGAMRLRVQSDPRLTDLYGQETPSAASKRIKISV